MWLVEFLVVRWKNSTTENAPVDRVEEVPWVVRVPQTTAPLLHQALQVFKHFGGQLWQSSHIRVRSLEAGSIHCRKKIPWVVRIPVAASFHNERVTVDIVCLALRNDDGSDDSEEKNRCRGHDGGPHQPLRRAQGKSPC